MTDRTGPAKLGHKRWTFAIVLDITIFHNADSTEKRAVIFHRTSAVEEALSGVRTSTMNVNLHPIHELVIKLREHGCADSADYIAMLMRSAWTSSSEFMGELGQAVLRFQRERPILTTELQDVLDRCMKEVRIVWPAIQ